VYKYGNTKLKIVRRL